MIEILIILITVTAVLSVLTAVWVSKKIAEQQKEVDWIRRAFMYVHGEIMRKKQEEPEPNFWSEIIDRLVEIRIKEQKEGE